MEDNSHKICSRIANWKYTVPVCSALVGLTSSLLYKQFKSQYTERMLRSIFSKTTNLNAVNSSIILRESIVNPRLVFAHGIYACQRGSIASLALFDVNITSSLGVKMQVDFLKEMPDLFSFSSSSKKSSWQDITQQYTYLDHLAYMPRSTLSVNPTAKLAQYNIDKDLLMYSKDLHLKPIKLSSEEIDLQYEKIKRNAEDLTSPNSELNQKLLASHPFTIALRNNLKIVYSDDYIYICSDQLSPGSNINDVRISLSFLPERMEVSLFAMQDDVQELRGNIHQFFYNNQILLHNEPHVSEMLRLGCLQKHELIENVISSTVPEKYNQQQTIGLLLALFGVTSLLFLSAQSETEFDDMDQKGSDIARSLITVKSETGEIYAAHNKERTQAAIEIAVFYPTLVLSIRALANKKLIFPLFTLCGSICFAGIQVARHVRMVNLVEHEVKNIRLEQEQAKLFMNRKIR